MNTIQQTIAKAHYVATDGQVEQLASAQYTASTEVEGHNLTYLRIAVVRVQAKIGTKRRGRALAAVDMLVVVESETAALYTAVLRGITTPDIAVEEGLEPAERSRRSLERNRRSTFARSTKTTLVNFVRGGGDLRSVDAETVTKAALRAAVSAPEPEGGKEQRILHRAQESILRSIGRLAKASIDVALDALDHLIEALQAQHAELESKTAAGAPPIPAPTPPAPRPTRTRVGVPQIPRGA